MMPQDHSRAFLALVLKCNNGWEELKADLLPASMRASASHAAASSANHTAPCSNHPFFPSVNVNDNVNEQSCQIDHIYPFFVAGYQVGFIRDSLLRITKTHVPDAFQMLVIQHLPSDKGAIATVSLSDTLTNAEERSKFFERMFFYLRQIVLDTLKQSASLNSSGNGSVETSVCSPVPSPVLSNGASLDFYGMASLPKVLYPLKGWRSELYGVWSNPCRPRFDLLQAVTDEHPLDATQYKEVSTDPESVFLFHVERSAVGLLGLTSYGVHLNGVVVEDADTGDSLPVKNKPLENGGPSLLSVQSSWMVSCICTFIYMLSPSLFDLLVSFIYIYVLMTVYRSDWISGFINGKCGSLEEV